MVVFPIQLYRLIVLSKSRREIFVSYLSVVRRPSNGWFSKPRSSPFGLRSLNSASADSLCCWGCYLLITRGIHSILGE